MSNRQTKSDVILIGAGIMSATLGTMLKELAPDWNISLFEKLDRAGEESSHGQLTLPFPPLTHNFSD